MNHSLIERIQVGVILILTLTFGGSFIALGVMAYGTTAGDGLPYQVRTK